MSGDFCPRPLGAVASCFEITSIILTLCPTHSGLPRGGSGGGVPPELIPHRNKHMFARRATHAQIRSCQPTPSQPHVGWSVQGAQFSRCQSTVPYPVGPGMY